MVQCDEDSASEEMFQILLRGGWLDHLRKSDPKEWLSKPGSPKAKLDNEKPKGETVNYDELVKRWNK